MRQIKFFILVIIQFFNFPSFGQSLTTSHLIWNLPLLNNAALTTTNYSRITADFRNAKLTSQVNYSAALLWMDYPVLIKNKNTGAFFFMVEKERSGSTIDFKTTKVNIAFSKKIMLTRLSHVNFALGAGYLQYGLSLDGLSTSSQYVPGIGFVSTIPNGESGFYKTSYLTINSGIFYQATDYNQSQLLKIGLSVHNLNKQLKDWGEGNNPLPIQYSAQLQYLTLAKANLAIGPDAILLSEGNKFNGVGGLSFRYYFLNPKNSMENEEGKHLNVHARVATQKKGILGFLYKSEHYAVGFSYDFPFGNLSSVYSNAFEVLFTLTPQITGKTRNGKLSKQKAKADANQQTSKKIVRIPAENPVVKDTAQIIRENNETKTDSASQNNAVKPGNVNAGAITSGTIPSPPQVNHVYFIFGSSELDDNSKEYLQAVYQTYLKNGQYKIRIVGYTDNVGSAEDNQKLSLKRAEKVYGYLKQMGVSSENVEIAGKGEEEPIASNDTREGRARNRRVDIILEEK